MMIETQTLIAIFGLIGAVVIGGSLIAGPIEQTGLPSLAVFLLLGLLIGPYGLGLIEVGLDDGLLRVVATLSLTLVLFTDALTLDLREVRQHKFFAALLLGPGTLLAAFGLGAIAMWLLELPFLSALILGAAVASTDPVVLRGMLQQSSLSDRLRLALRLESGMNDVLLLPIVLIALAIGAADGVVVGSTIGQLLVSLFLLGPLAGVIVGFIAVRALVWVRDRFGVRREYEAIYVIGVALAAFAAAEGLGGSGFLAAFAAGLMISALDVELCDCFLEYGQVTAEIALLFTYVLLGTGPIWNGLGAIGWGGLLFALICLVIRLPIFALALAPLGLTMRERLTVGWYGPRGLGSLLLALLAIFAGLPQAEGLVALTSGAVLLSVVAQGGWPLWRRRARPPTRPRPAAPITPIALDLSLPVRITPAEVARLRAEGAMVQLLDVRTERSFQAEPRLPKGAIRATPEGAAAALTQHGVAPSAWVIAYCT